MDEFDVYVNDEKTRAFIGMKVHASRTLLNILKDCDELMKEYDLETYYQVCFLIRSSILVLELHKKAMLFILFLNEI